MALTAVVAELWSPSMIFRMSSVDDAVLAMGSGQPAKVRVMGDGLGIRYKLGDANEYVGAPACVVGGDSPRENEWTARPAG